MNSEGTGEVIIYRRSDGSPALEVRLENDTLWLSQQQIADLFQTGRDNISKHISNVYAEGELQQEATCEVFSQVRQEGSRQVKRQIPFYNLDLIISVGYRVQSRMATQFRMWATERLREYLIKGFTMDDEKLKNLGGTTYWRELLERIRDIRSSEKVLYRQILDLYATSVDYDPDAAETARFFQIVQNKLHFAAHGHTAAEIVSARADASAVNMGLTSFKGERPTKSEVTVAKNYLNEFELGQLNTLVSSYFDAAEFRAQRHEPTYMGDWIKHLDAMIAAMGADVLDGPGRVSAQQAKNKAHAEYAEFRAKAEEAPSEVEARYLDSLRETQKKIGGKK